MGNSVAAQSIYAIKVPNTDNVEGQTAVYRSPESINGLLTGLPGIESVGDVWKRNFSQYPDTPFLGYRPLVNGQPEFRFQFMTFGEIQKKANAIGSGMINLGLVPEKSEFRDYKLKMVAIYAKNTAEWILLDAACCLYGITTVPIYDTLGEEACEFMFRQTNLTTAFCTWQHLKGLVKSIKGGNSGELKNLVIIDEENFVKEEIEESDSFTVYKQSEVMKCGDDNQQEYHNSFGDDIYTFSYTSGTTSEPKGSMISHKNIQTMVYSVSPYIEIDDEYRYVSYLPLAHVYERFYFLFILHVRGKYGIFGGDVFKLSEDLAILKPTIFASVPRLYNKFYDVIKKTAKDLTGMKKILYNKAVTSKLENLRNSGKVTHCLYDTLIFKKMKARLGGECQLLQTASAPIDPEVLSFLKICFCAPIVEAYGQTEGCGGEFCVGRYDPEMGHVGGPSPCNEFKLLDVPDMKYFSTDKDIEGRLCPRGEICVRGTNVIPAYYKNEEITAETFDKDGWLLSGDIGMILPGSNALKVIDRKKNIFKLSQGEYVAPEKQENSLKICGSVGDIFVYGDSLQSVLVAIISPDEKVLKEWAKELNIDKTLEDLCKDERIIKKMQADIENQQKIAKFKGFERIVHIRLDAKTFEANGLTTTTFKIKRAQTKEYYKKMIEEMYEVQRKIDEEKAK